MNDRNITIKDVYLSGEIDDYVVLRDYPNLHIVTTFDKELHAPIYSERMYFLFDCYQADKKIYAKVDKIYKQFKESVQNK